MTGMFVVLAGIFGWAIYIERPETWWKEAAVAVIFSFAYFRAVRVACDISRRHDGFAPERSEKTESKE
jgi:hypothetical protein